MKLIFNLSMTQTFLYHITTKEQSTPPSVKIPFVFILCALWSFTLPKIFNLSFDTSCCASESFDTSWREFGLIPFSFTSFGLHWIKFSYSIKQKERIMTQLFSILSLVYFDYFLQLGVVLAMDWLTYCILRRLMLRKER